MTVGNRTGLAKKAATFVGAATSASFGRTALLAVVFALLGAPGAAHAAAVSGTIIDHGTGAPIQGATVSASGIQSEDGQGGSFWALAGETETGPDGGWEIQVVPGMYMIDVKAAGYYWQGVGSPTGNNASAELQVGEAGVSGLVTSMVPDTAPFVGVFPPIMRWTREPKGSFDSMILFLEFGGFAAVPRGWTGEHVVSQVLDLRGQPVWPSNLTTDELVGDGGEGEGAPQFHLGSADGCNFFNSYGGRGPDVRHLTLVSYLKSDPTVRAEVAIVPDFSRCRATRLEVGRPIRRDRHTRIEVSARVLDRMPGGEEMPGTMTFRVDGHRPIKVRTDDATSLVSRTIPDPTHRGWNGIRVSFTPSTSAFEAPLARTRRFEIKGPAIALPCVTNLASE